MKRTPVLSNAESTRVVSGPITYSPDALPLLGPDTEVPNMWLAVGTGYGIGIAGKSKKQCLPLGMVTLGYLSVRLLIGGDKISQRALKIIFVKQKSKERMSFVFS